ncbi:hypothetical protein D3C72_2128830 [compost metagenome]
MLLFLQCGFLALHAFEQLVQVHGFLVVVGKACAQGPDHILFVGAVGEHDRLENPLLPGNHLQGAEQFNAIAFRHVQIAQHQADRRVGGKVFDSLVTGQARQATVAVALEKSTQLFDD